MKIILAVDILNGKVVKAFAGLRMNYKPLLIQNRDFSDAIKLIKEVKKKNPIERSIYCRPKFN